MSAHWRADASGARPETRVRAVESEFVFRRESVLIVPISTCGESVGGGEGRGYSAHPLAARSLCHRLGGRVGEANGTVRGSFTSFAKEGKQRERKSGWKKNGKREKKKGKDKGEDRERSKEKTEKRNDQRCVSR